MSKRNKILATSLWGAAVLLMVGIVACLSEIRAHQAQASSVGAEIAEENQVQPPMPEFTVAPFALTNQFGQHITNDTLKGHVWIASFIFTRCQQLCPMMSAEIETLQHKIKNPSVRIVSFSVDPKYDTPTVLKAYGQKYHADFDKWMFLTGPTSAIGDVATSLKLGVALGPNPAQLTHSDKLVLIGPDGKSRGIYTGIDDKQVNKLAEDADKLAAGQS
ncbi:MAG TPA: SCO family protein [Tepidisphaeraceae bacterium]|nr:SCO family protein [Tepidisphaeraceae bacterium]